MANNFANPYSIDTAMGSHISEMTALAGLALVGVDFTANPGHQAIVSDANGPKWVLNSGMREIQFGEPVLVRRFRVSTIDSGRVIVNVGGC